MSSRLRLEVGSFCFLQDARDVEAWGLRKGLPCIMNIMNIYCLCDLIYTYLPKKIYCNGKVSTTHSVTATSALPPRSSCGS